MCNLNLLEVYNNPPNINENQNILSKYPFNSEIITKILYNIQKNKNSYIKLNNINVFNDDNNYLNKLYFKNRYNFVNFINALSIKYKLTNEQKKYALKEIKNIKCIFCNTNYTYFADNLFNIYDIDNNIDITEKLCYDCIIKDYQCNICNIKLNEPYTIIFTYNKDKRYFLCNKCYVIKK